MRVSARDFIHPEDAAAQEELRRIPLFDQFLKTFLKVFNEQLFHNQYMSQAIRLGPRQLPHVHRHLVDCCAVLDVDVPELYLENSPQINAFSLGDTRRFVVVTWGLLQACDEDELHAVIAHECGHLVCRHTLYKTMAWILFRGGAQLFGPIAMAAKPIEIALAYWSRRSEFSADRAAAVVLGSAQPVVETMIRLAGGPKAITAQVDVDEYLRQAAAFDRLAESTWDRLLQVVAVMEASHPFNSVRAREILRWCESDEYQRLSGALRSRGDGTAGRRCPECEQPAEAGWRFCRHCGGALAGVVAAGAPPAGAPPAGAPEGGLPTAGASEVRV